MFQNVSYVVLHRRVNASYLSCHTYEWAVGKIHRSRIKTWINMLKMICLVLQCRVIRHVSHVTHVNGLCHAYIGVGSTEGLMSCSIVHVLCCVVVRICHMSHATHMIVSCSAYK